MDDRDESRAANAVRAERRRANLGRLFNARHIAFVLAIRHVGSRVNNPGHPRAAQHRINEPVVDSHALGRHASR